MTDLDKFRENWKVELGLKENEKLNQGDFLKFSALKVLRPENSEFVESELPVLNVRIF